MDESGIMVKGWKEIGESTYYFSLANGYMSIGITAIDGKLYEFADDGKLLGKVERRFVVTEEGTYYVNSDGEIVKGWQEIDGSTYYFSTTTGYMSTGRTYIDGVLYEFAEDGRLIEEVETGFIVTEAGTYYVDSNGKILKGWQIIDGYTYYFSTAGGYMRTGRRTVGGVL